MMEKVPENSSKVPARLVEPAQGQVPAEQSSLESAIALLLRAEHPDPFSLLGPHEVERGGVRRFVVRVLQPYAESVAVVIGNDEIRAERVSEGLFEASLPAGARPGAQDVISPQAPRLPSQRPLPGPASAGDLGGNVISPQAPLTGDLGGPVMSLRGDFDAQQTEGLFSDRAFDRGGDHPDYRRDRYSEPVALEDDGQ
jgi:hypothetical protein